MEFDDISPEAQARIDEAVAHDIAILEEHWKEMAPPPPTEMELMQNMLARRLRRLEFYLGGSVVLLAMIALAVLFKH